MEQKASMVIYQNGIRVMYSACHTVRNINYLRVLNCLKYFFSELIILILPIFSSSFNLFSHYYSHLLKQCSLMLFCSTAIYQSGIRRLLKLWKRVSIPDLRIVTTLLHLPKILPLLIFSKLTTTLIKSNYCVFLAPYLSLWWKRVHTHIMWRCVAGVDRYQQCI